MTARYTPKKYPITLCQRLRSISALGGLLACVCVHVRACVLYKGRHGCHPSAPSCADTQLLIFCPPFPSPALEAFPRRVPGQTWEIKTKAGAYFYPPKRRKQQRESSVLSVLQSYQQRTLKISLRPFNKI